jgi:RNA polymerase sigma-70 factor, ECF subfamily
MTSTPPPGRHDQADLDLVTAAQRGDRKALDQLLRRHQDLVWSICRRILGNDTDAADASQEAMVAMVRGLDRFDGRSRFSTWAYRIATNAALDEVRRRGRRAVPVEEVREVPIAADDQRIADRMALESALAHISEDFRVAVVLRDVADLDYNEIAEILNVPIGTVRSRIARGRGALHEILGNQTLSSDRHNDTDH